jgi:hypothetical protein
MIRTLKSQNFFLSVRKPPWYGVPRSCSAFALGFAMSFTPNFRVAKIRKLCARLDLAKLADRLVSVGLCLRPSAPAVGGPFWGRRAAGVCAVEERDAQSPRSAQKKDFTPFRAGSAASAWMPAVFWTRAGQPDSRESASPPCPAFVGNNFKGIKF